MRLLALLSLVSFVSVSVFVGGRLLLLARRTRGAPELAIGLGLVLLAVVGMPISAVGRLPSFVATPLGDGLFALGLQVACAGIGLLYAFTRRVFRPAEAWARGLVAAAAVALAVCCGGLLIASQQAATLAEIVPHTRPWAAGIIALVAGAFLWSGIESALYYGRIRRRTALGLADAVVANRFLLWAVSGLTTALLCGALMVFLLLGMAILRDPEPMITIAVAGLVSSAAWTLTFLPPAWYLRWIRDDEVPAGS